MHPACIAAGAAFLVGLTLRCCSTAVGGQSSAADPGAKELIDLRAVSTSLARHRAMAGISAAQSATGRPRRWLLSQ
jgi:hypothetical protein